MITTSKFSRDAYDYVTRIENRIVLVDGPTLAGLMIDHNVGVAEAERFIITKIDLDYFGE